jgi:hypothetical protein
MAKVFVRKVKIAGRTKSSRAVSGIFAALFAAAAVSLLFPTHAATVAVPGQSYNICDLTSQYLTSPWTYNALASGSQDYTVTQYQALPGYGTTLPPLPPWIAAQGAGVVAATIFAPGATVSVPAYGRPSTPTLFFFEGGSYGQIGFQTISGDQFIGGSAAGFPEPKFDNGGGAAGIDAGNDSHGYTGARSTVTATANAGQNQVTVAGYLGDFITNISFPDGNTYQIASSIGNTYTLSTNISSTIAAGTSAWGNRAQPLAKVTTGGAAGGASVILGASSIPLMQWADIRIGEHAYTIQSVTGSQNAYTVNVGALDVPVVAGTPVYYEGNAGNVTVSYLDIAHDLHNTTGTINTGSGWTITHNNIHDGYNASPGLGVAMYGGDNSLIEYNCMNKMGDYGVNIFGHNNIFRHNEIANSNYSPDPGCGCSGGGKWWGTLNADIVANAFIDDGPGGGQPIWLDNGNTGTNIADNFFSRSYASAIHSETGFNLNITNNLFQDGGWGSGTGGCSDNCNGAININSSGGWDIPGSRYNNQINVANNQFDNNWQAISIWQSGARSCENSGEGWPDDASYCTGGFPVSAQPSAGGQYYFSHQGSSTNQGQGIVDNDAAAGSTTVTVRGAVAINDQIGFADPAQTTTSSTTNVSSLTGTQAINAATTASFPSSGQLRVGTSAAWSSAGGSYTGAILSYTGKTATSFTGVSLVRGSGTLSGPVWQVQPYKVVSQTCYSSSCIATITPALSTAVAQNSPVTNAGTCQLFATSAATPTVPLAPNGTSYYDGCQWETRNIQIHDNTFNFDPAYIASHAPLVGGGSTTSCTAAHFNGCGTNFMAFQPAGEPPFVNQLGANAFMSNQNFAGCPSWDTGCTTNPLANLNALSPPPGGAPANSGLKPFNNAWYSNTYTGPWLWNTFIYGSCNGITDPATGKSMTAGACSVDLANWQSNWMQDTAAAIPPGAPVYLAEDINQDGHVNLLDFSMLAAKFGQSGAGLGRADINADGTVNLLDFSSLAAKFGTV